MYYNISYYLFYSFTLFSKPPLLTRDFPWVQDPLDMLILHTTRLSLDQNQTFGWYRFSCNVTTYSCQFLSISSRAQPNLGKTIQKLTSSFSRLKLQLKNPENMDGWCFDEWGFEWRVIWEHNNYSFQMESLGYVGRQACR